jgi:hypothetical protein
VYLLENQHTFLKWRFVGHPRGRTLAAPGVLHHKMLRMPPVLVFNNQADLLSGVIVATDLSARCDCVGIVRGDATSL